MSLLDAPLVWYYHLDSKGTNIINSISHPVLLIYAATKACLVNVSCYADCRCSNLLSIQTSSVRYRWSVFFVCCVPIVKKSVLLGRLLFRFAWIFIGIFVVFPTEVFGFFFLPLFDISHSCFLYVFIILFILSPCCIKRTNTILFVAPRVQSADVGVTIIGICHVVCYARLTRIICPFCYPSSIASIESENHKTKSKIQTDFILC